MFNHAHCFPRVKYQIGSDVVDHINSQEKLP